MLNLKPGMVVYVKKMGNAARGIPKESMPDALIDPCEVESVGQKYFKLKGWERKKFTIQDGFVVSDYSKDYRVYLSKQDIYDEYEWAKLLNRCQDKFRYSYGNAVTLTLDQLRRISAILDEPAKQ